MSESKQSSETGATPHINESAHGAEQEQDPAAAGTKKSEKEKTKKNTKKPTGKNKPSIDDGEQGPSTGGGESRGTTSHAALKNSKAVDSLLRMNPALGAELAGMSEKDAAEAMRKMDINQLLTGLSLGAGGKNQKDMANYKFWATQPVPRFDEDKTAVQDGPIKIIKPEEVSKEPDPLLDGFEWVTLDLTDEKEIAELYDLLTNHYVEDDNAMFRFNYSRAFLNWALKSPGWQKEWHVGVRASKSRKLVASICGVPGEIRVRGQKIRVTEINFLCVHKKLRSKRLAPVLIKEITRRCYLQGIYQAIYTAGVVLPRPASSCRYYHRPLDWLKLYEVGFSPLPPGSTKARQITRNHLPSNTVIPGLRAMKASDVDAVHDLLERYISRFDLNPAFTKEEINHWLIQTSDEQVVWAYVVEDPQTGKLTDFFSFYNLESSVISHPTHKNVKAAYLFYYATETAFLGDDKELKDRLLQLINDALIEAKKENFDVFNALTLQDNPLFLEQLKFGAGDGQLHYYLFNYRTSPIPGGVNDKNLPDERKRGGVGVVLL